MRCAGRLGITLLSVSAAVASASLAADAERSEIAPLASRSLLLDAAAAGPRLVVVGDRGHILLSDDGAKTWKQAKAPSQALLTGVYFVNDKQGWAVGHDETILRTVDGGATWERVHFAPDKQQPLLDVWFRDTDYGIAVGAYGSMLLTNDGGSNWTRQTFAPRPLAGVMRKAAADDEQAAADRHLNKIAYSATGKLYIAAEAGYLFRSDDEGQTWLELPSPYEGSFFGVLPLEGETVLAFGLRGHLFRSTDAGQHWTAVHTGTTSMLTDGVKLDANTLLVSGLAGALLVSRDGGTEFKLQPQPGGRGVQALLALNPRSALTVGEGGTGLVSP